MVSSLFTTRMGKPSRDAHRMTPIAIDQIQSAVQRDRLCVVVGAGVSLATCPDSNTVLWKPLLLDGLDRCCQHKPDLRDRWLALWRAASAGAAVRLEVRHYLGSLGIRSSDATLKRAAFAAMQRVKIDDRLHQLSWGSLIARIYLTI